MNLRLSFLEQLQLLYEVCPKRHAKIAKKSPSIPLLRKKICNTYFEIISDLFIFFAALKTAL